MITRQGYDLEYAFLQIMGILGQNHIENGAIDLDLQDHCGIKLIVVGFFLQILSSTFTECVFSGALFWNPIENGIG